MDALYTTAARMFEDRAQIVRLSVGFALRVEYDGTRAHHRILLLCCIGLHVWALEIVPRQRVRTEFAIRHFHRGVHLRTECVIQADPMPHGLHCGIVSE